MTEPRRLERAPAGYLKVQNDGLQSMVNVEDDGTRHARSVVAAIIAMFLLRGKSEGDARRNAVAAAILLRKGLSGSLLMTRQRAALAADAFLSQELRIVASDSRKVGTAVALSEEEQFRRGIEESRRALEAMTKRTAYRSAAADASSVRRASDAAKGYVQRWREKVEESIGSRASRGSNPTIALEDATAAVDHKIVTSVATETSNAFNAEHQRQVDDVVSKAGPSTAANMFLRWDATLDERTCSICSGMHGVTVPAKQGFVGSQPGDVHPRCRCVSELIWLPN